jgi:hypothetical protein
MDGGGRLDWLRPSGFNGLLGLSSSRFKVIEDLDGEASALTGTLDGILPT